MRATGDVGVYQLTYLIGIRGEVFFECFRSVLYTSDDLVDGIVHGTFSSLDVRVLPAIAEEGKRVPWLRPVYLIGFIDATDLKPADETFRRLFAVLVISGASYGFVVIK
jgi:hypothetical protein